MQPCTLNLYHAPTGKLYLKVQHLQAEDETHDDTPHPIVGKLRPRSNTPNSRIPASEWPTIVKRVVEQKNRSAPKQLHMVSHWQSIAGETRAHLDKRRITSGERTEKLS